MVISVQFVTKREGPIWKNLGLKIHLQHFHFLKAFGIIGHNFFQMEVKIINYPPASQHFARLPPSIKNYFSPTAKHFWLPNKPSELRICLPLNVILRLRGLLFWQVWQIIYIQVMLKWCSCLH